MIKFSKFLEEKKGLWDNIHAKRKRIKQGSGERMRKPGSEGAPTAQDFKDASESTLDEISDKAVDNYRKAAIKSYNKSANYFANQGYEPNPKSVAKHRENQRRRDRGIGSAYKRDLAKSSGQKYIHKPTYTRGLVGGKKDDAPQLTSKRADQLHKRYKDR